MTSMDSLPEGYRAIVLGSSGGIGEAFVRLLNGDDRCSEVIEFSRSTDPGFDLADEASIASASENVAGEANLIIDATGFLADDQTSPEKSLRTLEGESLAKLFELNAVGPALLIKHFSRKMPRSGKSVFATLSARVGSIGDNNLGGWYSYRASKAALNMLMRCAAIELSRTKPDSVLVSLHPGTVETTLSEKFAGDRQRLKPDESARLMLGVLDGLGAEETGTFWDHNFKRIEW